MGKMTDWRVTLDKYKWELAFCAGLLAAMVYCLAYFVRGSESYVQISDQLDGEVINYIYNAKYLFSGHRIVQEFMGGMDISSMTPPAFMGVLFYKLFEPFTAFAAMHIFSVFIGYVGMFVLLRSFCQNPLVVFVVSSLFIYLPFYPVYGLSVLGQPLLVWAFLCILKGQVKWIHYVCVVLYAIGSSLVLVGFVWLIIGAVTIVVLLIKKAASLKNFVIGYAILVGMFAICNLNLLSGFLGIGTAEVMHREEMVIAAVDVKSLFEQIFCVGGLYVEAYNKPILALAIVVLLGELLYAKVKKKALGAKWKALVGLLGFNFLIATLACFWKSQGIVDLRIQLGGVFKYFQFDRVYWILPLSWYVVFALSLSILMEKKWKLRYLCYMISAVTFLIQACLVYENSTIYHNLRLMIFPETYHLMSWDDYYAEDVFSKIEDCIGENKSEYKVVSLGINPAAALYNGFYTLDGYSNLYSLEYKHEFRKIIEKELEKNEWLMSYFDTWGNRCYLFNNQTTNYTTVRRYSGTYKNVELNIGQLQKMGAEYIFSAMQMENAEQLGLELLCGEPFVTTSSYYEIWVYKIPNIS